MEMYQSLCTEFYDLDKPNAPEEAWQFYLNYIEKAKGPILEPMCGSGRFLIPFLEKGFPIEGLDSSLHMLKACMKKCAAKQLEPTLYSQFITEMTLDKKYALIFIPSGSFGLITDKEQAISCLKKFFEHLLPEGKLVLEIETTRSVPKHLNLWHGKLIDKPEGGKLVLNSLPTYDPTSRILGSLNRYKLIHNQDVLQTEIEDFRLRLFEHEEMDNWLEEAGFTDISRFKVYGLAEPDENDEAIVYEAVRT